MAEIAIESRSYSPSLDKLFLYHVPERLCDKIRTGQCVLVPFGNKETQRKGFVFNVINDFDSKEMPKLKDISCLVSEKPFLTDELVKLAIWLSKNVFCTYFDAVSVISPANLEKRKKHLVAKLNSDPIDYKSTPKQQLVINMLSGRKEISVRDVLAACGASSYVTNSLRKKGIIDCIWIESELPALKRELPALRFALDFDEQQVYEQLENELKKQELAAVLLFSLSAKDPNVLLNLAKNVLESGKSVLFLVPEIELIHRILTLPQFDFGERVVILHSGLSNGERVNRWHQIKNNRAILVIGTRLAVFAPISDLGLIIVTDEQDGSYLSERKPLYSALEVAKFRAKHSNCLLVLASETPSITSFYKAQQGIYKLIRLNNPKNTVNVEILGVSNGEASSMLGTRLVEKLKENLTQKRQSIVVLGKKGYSTIVQCASCKNIITCPSCSANLVYHDDGLLHCHRCKKKTEVKIACEACGSDAIEYMGFGIERVKAQLLKFFDARILSLDSSTNEKAFKKACDDFEGRRYDILIGTQIVTRTPNFPDVTLVGVLGADQKLYCNDFESSEQTFSFLMQIINHIKAGHVIIQTMDPDDEFFEFVKDRDYDAFFEHEIAMRKILNLPPFCDIVTIGLVGKDLGPVYSAACKFYDMLKKQVSPEGSNPIPANIFKLNSNYRYKVVVKHKNDTKFRKMLRAILHEFLNSNPTTVRVFVDFHSHYGM
ncbi:MAG: primosomal protein N' [Oscillospiraceae bacterium]|nr:primosomal protein N' [Oscillospiraceae bacterium]